MYPCGNGDESLASQQCTQQFQLINELYSPLPLFVRLMMEVASVLVSVTAVHCAEFIELWVWIFNTIPSTILMQIGRKFFASIQLNHSYAMCALVCSMFTLFVLMFLLLVSNVRELIYRSWGRATALWIVCRIQIKNQLERACKMIMN